MAMQCFINQKPLNESIPWSDFCKPYQPKTIANKHHRKYYQTKAIAKKHNYKHCQPKAISNCNENIINQKQLQKQTLSQSLSTKAFAKSTQVSEFIQSDMLHRIYFMETLHKISILPI